MKEREINEMRKKERGNKEIQINGTVLNNEVINGHPPDGLQVSSTSGPSLTSFKRLSNLKRPKLRAVQPQCPIDINGASS